MFRRSCLLLIALTSISALADAYDFQIYQLGNPATSDMADANFRYFSRTMAAAVTSVNGAPAATLGHSGFAVTAELSMVFLQQTVNLQPTDPTAPATSMPTTGAIDHPMLLPSVHLRKGLPWSFELGVRAGWIERSRMGTGTLELKWALNEGFTYLPDIAVRGHITKILNSRDFDLTAGGLDLGIGKKFAIGGMVTLTPYVGWNLVFVGASSGTVDFNPGRSLADAQSPNNFTGYGVFQSVLAAQNTNNRFYGGFRFIGGYLQLGVEFSYTVLGSFVDAKRGKIEMPAVPALNFNLGFDF